MDPQPQEQFPPELPGAEPRPALPGINEQSTPSPAPPPFSRPAPPPPPNIPFAGPQANEPVFEPAVRPGAPGEMHETLEQASPHKRGGGLKFVIAAVIIIGLGAAGYFVGYPLFTAPDSSPTPAPEESASPLSTPPLRSHQSFFAVPASQETPLSIDPLSADGIAEALRQIGERGMPPGSLEEIIMRDSRGSQIAFPDLLGVFSVLDPDNLAAWFEDDFTAFLYYDEKGIWPGYLAKVKPTANRTELMTGLSGLENVII